MSKQTGIEESNFATCSTLVEYSIDPDRVSTYALCSCREEIIEFQAFHEKDNGGVDYYSYYLFYHGQLSRRDLNLGYSGIKFKDKEDAELFCDILECYADREKEVDPALFFDGDLPDKYLKKYGRGFVEVAQDYTIDLRKWVGPAAYEKHKRHPKRKNTCMWEVCLDTPVALRFAHEIKKILNNISTQLTTS